MKVIAAQGTQCPKEGKPREYITDSEPVDVPETVYYNRLVADGSLIEATNLPLEGDRGGDGISPAPKKEVKKDAK